MKTFDDINYPLRSRPRVDNRTADSMSAFESPARLMPDATAWTVKHAALLVLSSMAGLVIFVVCQSMAYYELVALTAAVVFVYGLGNVVVALPLLVPAMAALATLDAALGVFLLPLACQLAFAVNFARNYVYLQTAAPVSPAIAKKTRKSIRPFRFYLASTVFVFLAVGLSQTPPAQRAGLYHALSAIWYFYIPLLAVGYLLLPPYDKLGAFLRALREWFHYNVQHLDEPGVLRSPAGPAHQRLIPIYMLAFLFAAPFALARAHFSGATIGGTSSADTTFDLVLLYLSLLFRIADWWQLLLPTLTLLAATFLLTAPVLCHARRVARAARGSEFEGYLERLELMEARAR